MENEVWLPVFGYEDFYEVSSLGRVRSKDRWVSNGSKRGRLIQGRILKTPLNSQGRRMVTLYINQRGRSLHPYQLVARAFLGPCPIGQVVRHMNGDRTDDRISNLGYGTPKQNTADRILHGTMQYGELVHNAKLTNEQVKTIKMRYRFRCRKNGTMALAHEYGVSPSTVSAIMSGQNWSTPIAYE